MRSIGDNESGPPKLHDDGDAGKDIVIVCRGWVRGEKKQETSEKGV